MVGAGCTVSLDFDTTQSSINCISLLLQPGASVQTDAKKQSYYMTSYGFGGSNNSTAESAITATPPGLGLPAAPACPGYSSTDKVHAADCIVCAASTTTSPMPTALMYGTTGCCSLTLFVGTIFLPGQMIDYRTNQDIADIGQIYCGEWLHQSGDHPNPYVSRDVLAQDNVVETLKLVE